MTKHAWSPMMVLVIVLTPGLSQAKKVDHRTRYPKSLVAARLAADVPVVEEKCCTLLQLPAVLSQRRQYRIGDPWSN